MTRALENYAPVLVESVSFLQCNYCPSIIHHHTPGDNHQSRVHLWLLTKIAKVTIFKIIPLIAQKR